MLLVAVVCFFLVSWPPVDWLLSRPLEGQYHPEPFPPTPVQAIVVLAAAVHPPLYERPYSIPDQETFERCEYAAWVHRSRRGVPVLACGGRMGAEGPYSVVMAGYLERAGVPRTEIWTEERSRSTHENALFGADVLKAHGIRRIALVVDAKSMPRASACFEKIGITVVPAPSSFREFAGWGQELLPGWRAVHNNEDTLHEFVGLVWYRLRGWV
jgi:uncharacterized SAM-binding protein YcdF (DUF218 family)